jgi:Putative Actinobacterial Holin-X, holin superfamily III
MSQVNGGEGTSVAPGPPPNGRRRPVGVVVSSIINGTQTLFRKQIELAKIEAGEAVAVRAKGAGLFGAAAVLGLFAFGFVAASGSAALDLVLPTWAALLIVAAVLGVIGWVLVMAGRKAIRTAPKPELSQETLKEDARWAKRQLAR